MELTMSFPPKGTSGRPREERAVEGAVRAYQAVVECTAAGKENGLEDPRPNVKEMCEYAGVSRTDRDPAKRAYFFHLGRDLCVDAGLLTMTMRGLSKVYTVVRPVRTDQEVATAVERVITPEVVALPSRSEK
ncbi:hypothetical protein ACWELP_00775 [Rhodococcus aetherivorans]